MGWLMGLEPKRPGNRGIVMGRIYEGNRPLRHPLLPRIYPWIYPTGVRRADHRQLRWRGTSYRGALAKGIAPQLSRDPRCSGWSAA